MIQRNIVILKRRGLRAKETGAITQILRRGDVGGLRGLLDRHGYLPGLIIDESEHLPSSTSYQSRYGSLLRAYQLVGFTPDRDYRYIEINRALRELYPGILAEAIAQIEKTGGQVDRNSDTDLLTINR